MLSCVFCNVSEFLFPDPADLHLRHHGNKNNMVLLMPKADGNKGKATMVNNK